MTFNCTQPSIVFQEVPDQISLCFCITGCPVRCPGCHSPELWKASHGEPLTKQRFNKLLAQYQGLITCVLFFGGEWTPAQLIEKLMIVKQRGLMSCLYSGEDTIAPEIQAHLDFLKTGAWQAHRGGLADPNTNQTFINVKTGENLNHLFQSGE